MISNDHDDPWGSLRHSQLVIEKHVSALVLLRRKIQGNGNVVSKLHTGYNQQFRAEIEE
jgi:hypothetical protein